MSDRYNNTGARIGCLDCGCTVTSTIRHDAFHDRIDRLTATPEHEAVAVPYGPLICAVCGDPLEQLSEGEVQHMSGSKFWNHHEATTSKPEPLSCAVCGEPVQWYSMIEEDEPQLIHIDRMYRRRSHAATLTTPEPPAGTPVWWDGKWWARKVGYNSVYYRTDDGYVRQTMLWDDMPGAIPASIPEGGTA